MPEPSSNQPIPQRLSAIHAQLDLLRSGFDADALQARAQELEDQMQTPGFWDDQQTAAKVSAEHARASRRLEAWRSLVGDVDDLDALGELAEEDASMATELDETLAAVEARLSELEEERLFSGRYDAGDALVTVNAGAGGTDAQDWAEMVLRMLMRWPSGAASRSSCSRPARGRRRGSSRRRSAPRARTPTASSMPRRACTGSCACRRSTPPTAARRRSRASRSHPSSTRSATSTSATTTYRSTPPAPRAPAASTSTRPTRPCGSRTAPRTSSCSARTSARSRPIATRR